MITALNVADDGVLFYRTVSEDGTLNLFSLIPGSSLLGHPDEVLALAQATWTPEVVSTYMERLVSQCIIKGASA